MEVEQQPQPDLEMEREKEAELEDKKDVEKEAGLKPTKKRRSVMLKLKKVRETPKEVELEMDSEGEVERPLEGRGAGVGAKAKIIKLEGGNDEACDKANGDSDEAQRLPPVQGPTGGPTRRSSKGGWTLEEDEILRRAVQCYNGKNWKKIAHFFPGRTDVQCLHRWQKVINPNLVKGPWTKEEDEKIVDLVKKHGAQKWSLISQSVPGRIGKQCRERWYNHLNPEIKKEAWTQEEELALIRAHQIYGNKWAEIAKYLPGRIRDKLKAGTCLGGPLTLKPSSSCNTSFLTQKDSTSRVPEDTVLLINMEDRVEDAVGLIERLSEHASLTYLEAERFLTAESEKPNISQTVSSYLDLMFRFNEDETECKETVSSSHNIVGDESSTHLSDQPLKQVAKAKSKIGILEAKNADLRATLEAVKEQLLPYDSLILNPTYAKKLAAYPLSQQPMIELAMKANFYKNRHEIQHKMRATMAVPTGRLLDKSVGESPELQK